MKHLKGFLLFYVGIPLAIEGFLFLYGHVLEAYDGFLYDTQGYYVEASYDLDGNLTKVIHTNPNFRK